MVSTFVNSICETLRKSTGHRTKTGVVMPAVLPPIGRGGGGGGERGSTLPPATWKVLPWADDTTAMASSADFWRVSRGGKSNNQL